MFRIEGFAMSANIYAADWELRIFGRLNQRERLRGERLAAEAAKRRLKSASQEPAVPADENELLRASGFLAMSGQIVDATIVAAPKQRNTQEEKQALREGRIPADWKNKPAKFAQKDRDARWTIKYTKAKPKGDGVPQVDLAIPAFGYKNHIAIDRAHGLIRKWTATHAAAHDGARLEDVLDRDNTASEVWADTAYRSVKNEAMLARRGFISRSPQEAEGQDHAGVRACLRAHAPRNRLRDNPFHQRLHRNANFKPITSEP